MEPLVTADEFAGYLQRDLDRYTADLALAGASGQVRQYCRWTISREPAASVTVDGTGTAVLNLPTMKLNSVASITVRSGTAPPVAVNDYVYAERGQVWREVGWPSGMANVQAVIDHGHDETPDAVRIVVCALAARYYINPEGLRSQVVGDVSRVFFIESMLRGEFTEVEVGLLAGFRLP